MWINDQKVNFDDLIKENGLITHFKNIPNIKGLGDSTIWECTFENGAVYELEFMSYECKKINENIKC